MIPADPTWAAARAVDPVVQRYRALFALLDWSVVPERDAGRPWPGSPPHPRAAYIKALLVKLIEGKPYITELRTYLVEHPLLVLELGFRPVPDPAHPLGFDPIRTVPCDRWLRHQQQRMALPPLAALLADSVGRLLAEAPGFATTVAVDVTHLYAWVRENNPRESVPHRYDPARQPRGDPDCRLGVKARTNREERAANPATPAKEWLWGYGSGVVTAIDPTYGEAVVADWTQPFDRQDVTYFAPLYPQAVRRLGAHPPRVAADAAFDAWHVYQPWAEHGGLAAIPLNRRGHAPVPRTAAGEPICPRGLVMAPGYAFTHEDGYPARRHGCPLLRPSPTGASCNHPQFATGGCVTTVNLAPGGRLRVATDRTGDAYRALYRQRTAAERINSQAKALGLARPRVRRRAAVERLCTLTYLVINLRALQRIRAEKAANPPLC
jgi:hypothetical protein